MAAEIRLTKELKEVSKVGDVSGVRAVASGDSNRFLLGTINGPSGTPYEGGTFEIDIVIPQQYPFEPPQMVSFGLLIRSAALEFGLSLFCRDGISQFKFIQLDMLYDIRVPVHLGTYIFPHAVSKTTHISTPFHPLEMYYKNMAPKHLIPNRSHLP